jgi:excisionase family DNA binding protein
MEKLYSVKMAAEYLGVSPWTIYAWLSQGRMMRTKVGSRTMLRESELLKMIQDGGKNHVPRNRD